MTILRNSVAAEFEYYKNKLFNKGITKLGIYNNKLIWECTSTELKRAWELHEEGVQVGD